MKAALTHSGAEAARQVDALTLHTAAATCEKSRRLPAMHRLRHHHCRNTTWIGSASFGETLTTLFPRGGMHVLGSEG